jgi:nicotinamidase-related amidase
MMNKAGHNWDPFALLLIDAQHDFWPEKIVPHFPRNVSRLLTFCRREGLEIVHLRARFEPDMSDWMLLYRLRGHIPCVDGTRGAETLPFAVEEPDEEVIFKQTFDAFHSDDLLLYLISQGKRFLLTAGLITSTCVLFTTASAMQLGFLTAVVEDCCADEPTAHADTLNRYQFIFDRVTVDQIASRHAEWSQALEALAGEADAA